MSPIPWKGGINPVPGKMVLVLYRGSNTFTRKFKPSEQIDWSAMSSGPQVMAYITAEITS